MSVVLTKIDNELIMKSYKDIGCRNCGAVLPMELSNEPVEEKNIWFPGKKCPICGSQEFFPTIKQKDPVNVKTKKEWRYNPYYGLVALGIVIILIPVWVIFAKRSSKEILKNTILICEECKQISEKEVSGRPPYKCPKCLKKSAYQALYCPNDWKIYPRKPLIGDPSPLPACPECGNKKSAIIFDMKTVQDVQRKRRAYQEWQDKMRGKENATK